MSPELGRIVFVLGLLAAAAGLLAMLGVRLPIGRLPGDIAITGDRGGIFIPIATCVLLSILLTIILNVIGRR